MLCVQDGSDLNFNSLDRCEDLGVICSNQTGAQSRVDALTALEAVGYDIELAGAWLLGRDASALTMLETRDQLNELIATPSLMERLVTDMSRALCARDRANLF